VEREKKLRGRLKSLSDVIENRKSSTVNRIAEFLFDERSEATRRVFMTHATAT
jgi:hypothetical protein